MTRTIVSKQTRYEWLDIAISELNAGKDESAQEFISNQFDDNYFGEGSISIVGGNVDVESIWTNNEDKVMIHINHSSCEGDIYFTSLSKDNQLKIIEMMRTHVKNED